MSIPLRVSSFADYQRVLEIADRFNTDRPDLPISVSLAGHRLDVSHDPNAEPKGAWYLDVVSPSPARLQFFTDEITRIDRESKNLEKLLKLNSETKILALPEPSSENKPKKVRKNSSKKEEKVAEPVEALEENPLASALKKLFLDEEDT